MFAEPNTWLAVYEQTPALHSLNRWTVEEIWLLFQRGHKRLCVTRCVLRAACLSWGRALSRCYSRGNAMVCSHGSGKVQNG